VVWDIDDDEYAPAIARKAIYEVSRKKDKAKEQSTSRSGGRKLKKRDRENNRVKET
jgi:hypothetical protein